MQPCGVNHSNSQTCQIGLSLLRTMSHVESVPRRLFCELALPFSPIIHKELSSTKKLGHPKMHTDGYPQRVTYSSANFLLALLNLRTCKGRDFVNAVPRACI